MRCMQGSKEVFSQKFSQTAIFRTQAIDFVLEHQIVDLGVPRSSRGGGTIQATEVFDRVPRRGHDFWFRWLIPTPNPLIRQHPGNLRRKLARPPWALLMSNLFEVLDYVHDHRHAEPAPPARPDSQFLDRLATTFPRAWAEPVTFHNPLTDRPFTQTVYRAHGSADPCA
jgi:hypothetical protein